MHTEWTKDPQSRLDYTWDWTDLTGPVPDTGPVADPVVTKTVTLVTDDPYADGTTGLTIETPTVDATGGYVSAFLTGGTLGKRYALLCHVVTAAGRVDEHTAYVLIQNE